MAMRSQAERHPKFEAKTAANSGLGLASLFQQLLPVCDYSDRFRRPFRRPFRRRESVRRKRHGSAEALETGGGGHRHGHYSCVRGYIKELLAVAPPKGSEPPPEKSFLVAGFWIR